MSGPRPGESREEWLKVVARNVFTPGDHEPYYRGNVAITTGVVKVDRKHYPMQVYLRFKNSPDGRVYTGVEMTWTEVENLHADLGRALKEREALKKKLAPYAAEVTP